MQSFRTFYSLGLSQLEVIDNCILFYIGGYDTTSIAMAWLIRRLALDPTRQDILFQEIDNAFPNKSPPDYDNVTKLDYLNACVYESLRLNTSVVRVERVATQDTQLGPAWVPKGAYVLIPVHYVHRDPDNFDQPDDFIPERFMPENRKSIKAGTFLSFADGPRNCIGMRFALTEMKLTMCKLLQRYKFIACEETKVS